MPVSSKESFDIQATIECGFTLKPVHDMIRTYSQMHRTDKCSQHSSIIWPIWLNGLMFVYELSGCGFKSHCSHYFLRFCDVMHPSSLWWKDGREGGSPCTLHLLKWWELLSCHCLWVLFIEIIEELKGDRIVHFYLKFEFNQ